MAMGDEDKTREQLLMELRDVRLRYAQLEDELRQAKEETKAARQARIAFLSNLSHEFRTPLNAIIGFAGIALVKGPSPKDPFYFEQIKRSGISLLYMIDNLLNLSLIISGRERIAAEAFSLREVLESVISPYRACAQDKGIGFSCAMSPEVPDHLLGDTGNLRQALGKLLDNALMYTAQGHVRVSVALTGDPCLPGCVRLCFRVEDTGSGIPEDKLALIFDSFAKVGIAQHGRSIGLGIGLATAKSLIELMGGSIWVESALGVGSTFSFTISYGIPEGIPNT